MRKSCFTTIIFLLLFIVLKAQNNSVALASLHLQLNTSKNDISRIKIYNQLGLYYLEFNWDSSFFYIQKELVLSKSIKFTWGEAVAMQGLGYLAMQKGNYPQSLNILFQSVKLSEPISDSLTAQAYHNIALTYFYIEDYIKARDYYLKSKSLVEKSQNHLTHFYVMTNLGRTYLKIGQLDSALIAAQDAYEISNHISQNKYLGILLITLGEIHILKGNKEIGFAFLQRAVSEMKAQGSKRGSILASLALARYFKSINQFDSAIAYATSALTQSQENLFMQVSFDAVTLLSKVYHIKGEEASAYRFLAMATEIRNELFNQEKQTQLQSLAFNEKLRQIDEESKKKAAIEERKNNLQYAAIALGLVFFVILFLLLSHSVVANQKVIRFLVILALLIVFEFINLFLHPYLGNLTNHSPLMMLGIMVGIAALLIPMHHQLEKWITHRLVEKNKKIRLAAAKKTIAKLEGEENLNSNNQTY